VPASGRGEEPRGHGTSTPTPGATLVFLDNRGGSVPAAAADRSSHVSRDRFKRVLEIVRKEATTLEAFNSMATLARRKRQMSNDLTVMVQQEQEELRRRQHKEDYGGISRDEDDEGYRSEDEMLAARDMFHHMLGYELSSSSESEDEDEYGEEGQHSGRSNTSSYRFQFSGSEDNDDNDDEGDEGDVEIEMKDEEAVSHNKGDEIRSTSTTVTEERDKSIPRRGTRELNKDKAKQKKQQHELHSIMRQESLAERKARAARKLKRRKRQLQRQLQRRQESGASANGDDEETFEARKNMVKEYKAYNHMRRGSQEARETRQRESLMRRLQQRREELQLQHQMEA